MKEASELLQNLVYGTEYPKTTIREYESIIIKVFLNKIPAALRKLSVTWQGKN